MRKIVACHLTIGVLALLLGYSAAAQNGVQDTRPFVMVTKLGGEEVVTGRPIVLHELSADLFGFARNSTGERFIALLKLSGSKSWQVAGSSGLDPGGVFNILDIRFPGAGEYDLLVGVFRVETRFEGDLVDEKSWRSQVEATSDRITVSVLAAPLPPPEGASATFSTARIISISNIIVRPDTMNPVPAAGTIMVEVGGPPTVASVYVSRRIPYTDRCTLLGPARRTSSPGQYILPGMTFESPGDPQQMHFELTAFASERLLKTGEASCEALRHWDTTTSLPIEVIVEQPRLLTDDPRVGYLAITQLGKHVIDTSHSPGVLTVRPGDEVEVAQFDRIVEGDRIFILTRRRGSRLWLAQGPAIKRGGVGSSSESYPRATWVWLDLQFSGAAGNETDDEFETVALASTSLFPNAVVDSTFPASKSVHALSRIVRVRVEGLKPAVPAPIFLIRVESTDLQDTSSPITVGASGLVLVSTPKGLPDGMRVYVARHKVGSSTYSLFEAIDRQNSHVVPDLSFINPHPEEGAEYQLLAIEVWGKVAMTELTYDDVVNLAVGVSDVVTVRYSAGDLSALHRFISQNLSSDKEEIMIFGLMMVSAFLVVGALAYLLRALVRNKLKPAPYFSRDSQMFAEGASRFVLGVGLLILVVYVIQHYYLALYASVVGTVANLPERESLGLAVYLVLITALLGIFFDISYEYSFAYATAGDNRRTILFRWIGRVCLTAAAVLWLFQGGLYFEMLSLNSFGVTPLLGGMAFTLIAIAETMAFFFITKLILPPLRLRSQE